LIKRVRNRSRSDIFPILDILSLSEDIRDQNLRLYKLTEILHVLASFLGGGRVLLICIQPVSDHVAKFNGDRPRDLGDLAAKKNICGKT